MSLQLVSIFLWIVSVILANREMLMNLFVAGLLKCTHLALAIALFVKRRGRTISRMKYQI